MNAQSPHPTRQQLRQQEVAQEWELRKHRFMYMRIIIDLAEWIWRGRPKGGIHD